MKTKMYAKKVNLPEKGSSFERIAMFVGRIASVCSGKNMDSRNALKVGLKCLKDAHAGTPSKPWEYIRVTNILDAIPLPTKAMKFPNARDFLKTFDKGKAERIAQIYTPEGFFVIQCRSINMIWYQLSTHRENSPLKESLRYLKNFWFTEYEFPKFHRFSFIPTFFLNKTADFIPPLVLKLILRIMYRERQLQNRDHNAFRLVNFYLCGTKEMFQNMINERTHNTCVPDPDCSECKLKIKHCAQKETREFVNLIKNIVEEND